METLSDVIEQIKNYVSALDWRYIITFILICYGINHYKVKAGIEQVFRAKTRKRYRVAVVGVLYGIVLYFIRGYELKQIENLLQSFFFALVFHKFIVDAVLYWMAKHGLPESISKHILSEKQINKIKDNEGK